MRVVDEQDRIRVADAEQHDECLVMIADESGRPLLKLSVTKEGHGIIEADDGDLAPGIRQLNKILSAALRGETPVGAHI